MRTTLIAALVCGVGLVFTCGCKPPNSTRLLEAKAKTEPDEGLSKQFQKHKAEAEKGDATAQSNLGICYANGLGVEKDQVEAVKWWRKAAEQLHAPAQYNLGRCFFSRRGRGEESRGGCKVVSKSRRKKLRQGAEFSGPLLHGWPRR